MEEALTAWLLAGTGLTALVGTRITWDDRPQGEALPAITLSFISPGVEYHHGGASTLAGPRVQCDCWGAKSLQAAEVSRALRSRMEALSGAGHASLRAAFLAADRTGGSEDIGGGNMVFRRIVDFFVWHQA